MTDSLSQFHDAIRATGLEPPKVIEPGKLHRFPGVGKRSGNTAGWCKLFDDGLGGCFGDWSSGFSENWQAEGCKSFTTSKRAAFKRYVAEARTQAKVDRNVKQNEAANRAATIWNMASVASSDHLYLIRKAIKVNGARLHKGALVLPVQNYTGKLTSLQFIQPNGRKQLLSGGRKQGCFIHVAGNMTDVTRVIICEGWATGCTLADDEPASLVLAAIDAGNLESVAITTRRRWPSVELVIAGDDDRQTTGNPGATKAKAAALAADALLALPQWPSGSPKCLSDFNDLSIWLAGGVI